MRKIIKVKSKSDGLDGRANQLDKMLLSESPFNIPKKIVLNFDPESKKYAVEFYYLGDSASQDETLSKQNQGEEWVIYNGVHSHRIYKVEGTIQKQTDGANMADLLIHHINEFDLQHTRPTQFGNYNILTKVVDGLKDKFKGFSIGTTPGLQTQ